MVFTKKPKSNIGKGSLPWLPANVKNLPKNIPPFKKNRTFFDPWPGIESKVDKMNEALKIRKQEVKQRKSKKIRYKKIDSWQYEVFASERPLGLIKEGMNRKWKIVPTFKFEETFFSEIAMREEHYDFREAGNALVKFWLDC